MKDKQLISWILTKSQTNNMLSNIKDQTWILIRRSKSQTSQYAFKINKWLNPMCGNKKLRLRRKTSFKRWATIFLNSMNINK